MIVFESAPSPSVKTGEAEIGGRRVAGRLCPYIGEFLTLRFDPLDRRFVFRKPAATVSVGPADPRPWGEAASRIPPGPVLIGPGCEAEEVRGALRAAADAALAAGRPVYLLDPDPAGLPEEGGSAVVLCSWRPGGRPAFPDLARASEAGFRCGVFFPLIAGWTAEPPVYEALLAEAAAGGAASATALSPESGGDARRAIVEARATVDSEDTGRFFELVHHEDWTAQLPGQFRAVREACARHGLATLPPRPVGRRQPAGNAAAAARLEERAELPEADEHRAALLHAAVRWIDESRRDLSAVARDGNFRKIFPFGGEIAAEAEAAFREAC
jgi:hypothetical protein